MAILEPNDSIMFRLNTVEFDESLVFTGAGAKKNNYLINMFLENEIQDEKVLQISQLSPTEFEHKLDSLKVLKNRKLKEFNTRYTTSPLFQEVAQANIDYNYYLSKEVYPFAFYGNNELKNLAALPSNFYEYRKQIDYNSETLKDYFPYYSFLRYHFSNLALSEHFKQTNDSTFNRKSLGYNLEKLSLIDSLVKHDSIKNSLLSMTTISFINSSYNSNDFDSLLNSYFSKSSNKKQQIYITKLANSLKQLKPGSDIPNIKLVNYQNNEFELQSIIKKPTVIYFWSTAYRSHFKDSHKKVIDYNTKYPELDFIAINVSNDNAKLCLSTLRLNKFPIEHEYQLVNPKDAKHVLAINPINKVIIIDNKGKIVNPHTNMFSMHFEEQLLGLLNR